MKIKKKQKNGVLFNGKNFQTVVSRIPHKEGIYRIYGQLDSELIPINSRRVKNHRVGLDSRCHGFIPLLLIQNQDRTRYPESQEQK